MMKTNNFITNTENNSKQFTVSINKEQQHAIYSYFSPIIQNGGGANLLGLSSSNIEIPIEECKERIIKLLTDLGTPKQITLDEVEESCFVGTNSYSGKAFYLGSYDDEIRLIDELEIFGTVKFNEAHLFIEELLLGGLSVYKDKKLRIPTFISTEEGEYEFKGLIVKF